MEKRGDDSGRNVKTFRVVPRFGQARDRVGSFLQHAAIQRAYIETCFLEEYILAGGMSIVGGILVERGIIPVPITKDKRILAVGIGVLSLLTIRLTEICLSGIMVLRERSGKGNDKLEQVYRVLHHFDTVLLNFAGGMIASRLLFSSTKLNAEIPE